MPGSSFGTLFKITTFGESHGGAVGVVLDGATPGVEISENDIQVELDRRKPGQSDITTPREETDTVSIQSGLFEGKTTGTPILMIIYNKDARPSAYNEIKDLFRPGHADFTYQKKYGVRDYCGSGRASGRETAGRVAAGAVAKKILKSKGIEITAFTAAIAGIKGTTVDYDEIEKNPVRAADPEVAKLMTEKIIEVRDSKNSVGGIIECHITGVPTGLGEPVFDKLDADLAKAIISLGATKGIEFGSGFSCAEMTGKEHNDCMDKGGFKSNNAGGILGGISNGNEIIFRVAVKPTSSIAIPQQTINKNGEEVTCITEGRHDPCICPRIVPVIEAMSAIVLCDHMKRQAALHA
jgi:chorismate synthase